MVWKSNFYPDSQAGIFEGKNPSNPQCSINLENSVGLKMMQGFSLGASVQNMSLEQKEATASIINPSTNSSLNSSVNGDNNYSLTNTICDKESHLDTFDADAPKILVVDDHAASRMTAVALLAMEGYQTIEVDSGTAAVEIVAENQPDLILLDVMMPGMDGFEVCQRIKQDEQTRLIPIIFITALNDRRSRIRGIEVGADDFISKPFDRLELAARVKSLVTQKRLNEDLDHAEKALFSIARAIESRDPNTGDHCERLVKLGQEFGEYLNLSRTQIRDLSWGGYLHDIGKVGIPDAVLLKRGKLTTEEWEIMRRHVMIGEGICKPLRSMRGVIPIIRHHHERWDGQGYPDRLKGNEIPYLAQIFQILDIYDALTSERPYKQAYTPTEALQMMNEETQKGWRNPELMAKFVEFIQNRT